MRKSEATPRTPRGSELHLIYSRASKQVKKRHKHAEARARGNRVRHY